MKNVLALIIATFVYSCTGINTPGSQTSCDKLKQDDKGFVQLTKKKEAGEKLIIYGKVLNKETSLPVKNASLFLYHTDTAGHYNSWFFGYPALAKIRGTLYTNDSGCFKIQTIFPGDYPGAKDNRHIHFVLKAKGYKTIRKEFLFDGFLNDEMRKNAIQDSSGIILNINKDGQGTWIGTADLYIER